MAHRAGPTSRQLGPSAVAVRPGPRLVGSAGAVARPSFSASSPSASSPFGPRPESREPNRSGTRAEATALALSESASAPTEILRKVAETAGAPAGVTAGSRKTLVQALGAEAVAAAGGESLATVVDRMRASGFAPSDVASARLFYPDPNLLAPAPRYAVPRPQKWDRVPIYALMGLDLASAEDNGSGSASAPPFAGMPGAVPYRAGNWSDDFSEYTIAEGDTFCGLGKTYGKGLCAKGIEIFSYQPDKFSHCMDPLSCTPGRKLYAPGDVLQMPPWAQEQAKAYAAADVPSAPSTPGAPGYGNQAPGKPDKPGGKKPGGGGGKTTPSGIWEKHKVPILLGAAAVGVGALVAFA